MLDALVAERWPGLCEESLRVHVHTCRACSDLVQVVGALNEAGGDFLDAAGLPSAGTVWWRAQIRARREAAREAAGPVTVAQVVGFVSALFALLLVLWAVAPWLSGFGALLPGVPSLDLEGIRLPGAADLLRWRWVLAAVAAWLVLAPLAVYLAIVED